MKLPDEIKTLRLVLRPVSHGYEDILSRELTEEVTKYMYISPETSEEAYDWVERTIPKVAAGSDLTCFIFLKDTDEFIGGCGLHDLDKDHPEFGVWTKKSAHGNGFGREAVKGLYDWALLNTQYEYFLYPADRRNLPSRKIAESLGGKIVKEYKQPATGGKILDTVEYHIYKG